MNSTKEKEISALEEKLRLAMETSNVDEIDKLLSPSLLFTNHLGQVITKNDDLEGHRKKDLVIESLEL